MSFNTNWLKMFTMMKSANGRPVPPALQHYLSGGQAQPPTQQMPPTHQPPIQPPSPMLTPQSMSDYQPRYNTSYGGGNDIEQFIRRLFGQQ